MCFVAILVSPGGRYILLPKESPYRAKLHSLHIANMLRGSPGEKRFNIYYNEMQF